MKFSWKLSMWIISIVAVTLAFGGYYIVNSFFKAALSREIRQSLDENGMVQFAFETGIWNIPSKYGHLENEAIAQIGGMLDDDGEKRWLRLSGETFAPIYQSNHFVADASILKEIQLGERGYKIFLYDGRYYIQTAVKITIVDRMLYLDIVKDMSNVFTERDAGFSVYQRTCLVILCMVSGLVFFLARWITRPVRILSNASRNMAEGNYNYRAPKVSEDELGALTEDFNQMACSLEKNMAQLQKAVKAQEEFAAAFAHELKTPLTAIIGYADMLRSQMMSEEKRMMSADYIYKEGRRLEKLSLSLLDLIVLKKEDIPEASFYTKTLFQYLIETYRTNLSQLYFQYEAAVVQGDLALIKTLLTNLIDNAQKASETDGAIQITAKGIGDQYQFMVVDEGCGISPEDLSKITEAFYMVDKSRSRSRHGAGLGLTLCSEIALLHGSKLQIQSEKGKGTTIKFTLKIKER